MSIRGLGLPVKDRLRTRGKCHMSGLLGETLDPLLVVFPSLREYLDAAVHVVLQGDAASAQSPWKSGIREPFETKRRSQDLPRSKVVEAGPHIMIPPIPGTSRIAAWPAIVSSLILMAIILWVAAESLRQNDGHFVYALDDCYIHMAVAKDFVVHGVWGTTPEHFTSSTSSVLWPLMLSGVYAVLGPAEIVPLVLNLIIAVCVLALCDFVLRRYVKSAAYRFGVLLMVLFVTPLPAMVLTGMEHGLQLLATVVFIYFAARVISSARATAEVGCVAGLCLLGALLTAVRYEGFFAVAGVCFLLLLRKRWFSAALLAGSSVTIVGAFGLVSVLEGWYWLPNSILLKSSVLHLHSGREFLKWLYAPIFIHLHRVPELFFLVTLGVCLYLLRFPRASEGHWKEERVMAALFLLTASIHLRFAETGWFYRYEAYLIGLGLLTTAVVLASHFPALTAAVRSPAGSKLNRLAMVLLMLFTVSEGRFLFTRAWRSLHQVSGVMQDRYYEHILTARFVSQFYDKDTIVINDLGAMSFYTHARLLDMYGLGSIEPLRFRWRPSGYTRQDVLEWARRESAKIAILKFEWREIGPRIPREWTKVGEWELPQNPVFGDTRVGFYAVDPGEEKDLVLHLHQFAPSVPNPVRQRGEYLR
jgi:hypothetical protein